MGAAPGLLSGPLQEPTPRPAPGPAGLARLRLLYTVRRDRLAVVDALQRGWGDVAELAFGPLRILVISEPTAALEVLRDSARFGEKGIGLAESRYLLGDGLLTASGPQWSEARKAMAGLFRRSGLAQLVAAADASIADAIPGLAERAAQGPVALEASLETMALDTTARALIGRPVPGGLPAAVAHFHTLRRWVEARFAVPVPAVTALAWRLSPAARAARDALAASAAALAGGDDPAFAPAVLTRAGMDRAAIRDQVLTLLLAGHETTAAAAAWCLDQLTRHPDLAARVAAEGAALGEAAADLARLPFTTAAVKEAVRLFPPVWALPRRANEAAEIAGFRIRAGTQVIVNLYGIHRHPAGWDDAAAFKPERFLAAASEPPFYLPFGVGGRQCIGRHFGLAAAVMIVARLCARFRFEACGGPPPAIAGLTLRPAGPPAYRMRPR